MIVQRAALVLIVEGILTAIPTVLAVNLPIGAEQSAKRKALGIHTAPIEKIPAVTIPYSDKTSTVQTNKIIIEPETGKLSSKGQARQRRDHPRLRLRRAPRQYGDPSPRLLLHYSHHTSSRSIKEKGYTRVPSVKIASSTPASYVELVQYPLDGTIQRMSSVDRSTTDYPHSTDNVAQVYFVKDAVEPDLLAGSNTVFSREETKDSEVAMLLIREIDEGMGGRHSLSHGDYGEQVPSDSCPCSTF
ncbi:hypothetical protein CF327_g3089 [Tilletia walkeri]|nr:hypothetical protein CF327_g3089 [Tilletia walkeri]